MQNQEYKVVYADGNTMAWATKRLEEEVNKLQKAGWKLQGGVSVSIAKDGYFSGVVLAQAMVKDNTNY